MKISGTRKSILMLAIVVALIAVFLVGCDSAGAGGGGEGGGGTSGGSYDITFEVSGFYSDSQARNLQVDYSYSSSNQGSVSKQPIDPPLPFSDTVTLEAGAGVSLQATLLNTGDVRYTLKENGTVIESLDTTFGSAGFIYHTVGQ